MPTYKKILSSVEAGIRARTDAVGWRIAGRPAKGDWRTRETSVAVPLLADGLRLPAGNRVILESIAHSGRKEMAAGVGG